MSENQTGRPAGRALPVETGELSTFDPQATQVSARRVADEVGAPVVLPPKEILTLPPLDELQPGIPVSEATGQPRRDPQMLVAIAFLYASSVAATWASFVAWWTMIHLHTFATSIRIIEWTHPESWSLKAVLLAVAAAASGAAMVAAPAIAAFNAWNGYRWSRIAAIVAVVISLLAILLNDWAWVAVGLAVVGAALLWLPAVTRYFSLWQAFRTAPEVYPRDVTHVQYGPEPRYL